MASEDTKLEVLNDHYKDTFAYVREYIGIRDRFVFYILITISVLILQIFSPEYIGNFLSNYLSENYKFSGPLNLDSIGSAIWFLLLALVTKYFQTVVYIEGQYIYLHKLEGELSKEYDNVIFTREGKSYLKGYSCFSRWMHIIYREIFPVLLSAIVLVKIIGEWIQSERLTGSLIFDSIIAVCIFITVFLYGKTIFTLEKGTSHGSKGEKMDDDHTEEIINLQEMQRQNEFKKNVLEFYTSIMAHTYDRASTYSKLIITAGYALYFTFWGNVRGAVNTDWSNRSAFLMIISAVFFILWEIVMMILTAIEFRKLHCLENIAPDKIEAEIEKIKQKTNEFHANLARFWIFELLLTIIPGFTSALILIIIFIPTLNL